VENKGFFKSAQRTTATIAVQIVAALAASAM
jgi:hypothetical protein